VISASLCYTFNQMPKHSKTKEYFRTLHHKKPVRALTAATLMLALPFVGAYSYFIGVKRFKIDHIKLEINSPHSQLGGMKIVQISDLHYGPTNKDKRYFNRIVDIINLHQPDLIVLTGDYYQWDPKYLYDLPKMLTRLRAPLGLFGCLGNHDYGSCYPGHTQNDPFEEDITKDALERQGIRILTNEAQLLEYKKQKFNLIGLHDLWSNQCDPNLAFKKVNSKLPTFVLSHNPDSVHIVKHDYDLMLSGHSHGGQVTWPIVGSLAIPQRSKKYSRGLHQINHRKRIYINRGLGHTFRLRINSQPEITLFEII